MSDAYQAICERAARAGGEVLLSWLGKIKAREKGRRDLVTEADLESQQVIQDIILDAHPEHRFLGEETAEQDRPSLRDAIQSDVPVWIVDPLDGTTNFVHGLPPFGVSIAVAQRGEVLAGVVLDPFYGECFSATRGGGARLNGQPIQTSDCESLESALLAASFSANVDRNSVEIEQFLDVMLRCQAVRRLGSAALNLCFVAAGRLDGYWATSVKVWDVAAGALILREAGGVISHSSRGPFSLLDPRFAAAATPGLQAELLEVLSAVNVD